MVKRYGYLYEKVYDLDNLRLAHKNARKGKTNYRDVKMVDSDVDFYLLEIQKTLIGKTYKTSEYDVFTKVDKGKEREIYRLPYYPDRIVQWAIMQILEPIWMAQFTRNTFSSIPGRGIHDGLRKLDGYMADRKRTQYCLKIDVQKFYPSINHVILKRVVARKIKDKDMLWIIGEIIDSIPDGRGVPIGNYLSQYLGNIFLTNLDKWLIAEKGVTQYLRYCDDCVIFHESKQFLHDLLRDIIAYLSDDLDLTIKSNYQVFPTYIRGVDFLGYRSFGDYRLLRKSTTKRYKRLCRTIKRKAYISKTDRNRLASYNGWLIPANSYNLRKKYEKELGL